MSNILKVSLTNARHKLGDLIMGVLLRKDKVILEKNGNPVAIVVNIEEYENLTGEKLEIIDETKFAFQTFSDEWLHPSNDIYDNL